MYVILIGIRQDEDAAVIHVIIIMTLLLFDIAILYTCMRARAWSRKVETQPEDENGRRR